MGNHRLPLFMSKGDTLIKPICLQISRDSMHTVDWTAR